MNFNIDVRKKQLQSLDQYITSSRDKILSILSYLGWNSKEVVKSEDKIICPINQTHKIPTENVDQHVQKCCLRTAGYQLEEQFLSEPAVRNESSIVLDNPKKIEILTAARQGNPKFVPAWNGVDSDPMTSDRLFSTFSTDERLAVYEYCVQNTVPPPTPSEFDINIPGKDEKKDLTQEEQLEKERNAKRRRIKYKSVHTGRNRSYTEVIREVIGNQMELYEEYLQSVEQSNNVAVEEPNNHNEHSDILDSSQNVNSEPISLRDEYRFIHADREEYRKAKANRKSREKDRHRDYKEKSHKKIKSIHDRPYERQDSYHRSRHRR